MPPHPPPPVAEWIDSLLTQVTTATTSKKTRRPLPPVVDLDSTPLSAQSDDDVTVVRDSRSVPPSQDDDEIEIVSAAFVTTAGQPPIHLDVDVAECIPAPDTIPQLVHSPTQNHQISTPNPADIANLVEDDDDDEDANHNNNNFSQHKSESSQDNHPKSAPVIDVEAQPEVLDSSDDEVVVCSAPSRRPRPSTTCDACTVSLRGHAPLLISRCKHGLCPRCALRSIANLDTVIGVEDTDLVATSLRSLPTCVVPRCRAPLSRPEVDAALVSPIVDDSFAIALALFHSWRGEDPDDDSTGAALIEFPPFSPDAMHVVVQDGVIQGADHLVDDDVATACEPLWVLDEEASAGRGAWICAACGKYDELATSTPEQRAESSEDDPIDVDDDIRAGFRNAPPAPAYPHCQQARALGVYENVRGLARVWEDEKDAAERRREEEKLKENGAQTGEKPVDRRRKTTRKRYTSASTIRNAKRRKTTKTGFAKGTGYAGSKGSEWKGPSEKLLDEVARLDAEATYWLVRLRCFLMSPDDARLDSWPGFMRVLLRERRLVAHLSKILINESIMDVLGRIPVFYSALRVVHILTETPSLRVLVTEPSDGDKGRSIVELVESLSRQAALLSTGAGPETLPEATSFLIRQIRKCIRVINRHNLLQAARNRNAADCPVDLDKVEETAVLTPDADGAKDASSAAKEVGKGAPSGSGCFSFDQDKKMYIEKMKAHQFQAVPGLAQTSVFYSEAMRAEQSSGVQTKRQRRIASEVASLFSSLPLSWSSTILLRVDEDRYDFLRACIFGPDDTPYDSGAFVFDIFLPLQYPYVPPKFRLLTTGGGRVRFNPNLYNTGKVCLSLLGTWSGPSWTSASTILQVLVSIQSLILVSDPYFNEPGYERNVGTDVGRKASAQYNARVRLNTAFWAIQANVRHPQPDLEAGILAHFRLKHRYLTYRLRKWFPMTPKQQAQDSEGEITASTNLDGSNSHMVVSADPTTNLSNLPGFVMNPSSAVVVSLPSAGSQAGTGSGAGTKVAPNGNESFASNGGATVSTFGSGRNFRAPEMSQSNLEAIIADLEAIPP